MRKRIKVDVNINEIDKLIDQVSEKYNVSKYEVTRVYWRHGLRSEVSLNSYFKVFNELLKIYPDVSRSKIHKAMQENKDIEMIFFNLSCAKKVANFKNQ